MPRLRGIDLPELLSVQGSGMRGAGVKPSARASNAKPHADAAVHPRIRAPAAAQPKAPPRAHAGEPRRPQQQHVSEHGRRVVAPIVARGQGFGGGVSVMNVQFPANASRGGADEREWDRRGGPGACPGGGALTRGDARRGAGYPNAARGGRHAALRRPASARRRRPETARVAVPARGCWRDRLPAAHGSDRRRNPWSSPERSLSPERTRDCAHHQCRQSLNRRVGPHCALQESELQ